MRIDLQCSLEMVLLNTKHVKTHTLQKEHGKGKVARHERRGLALA